MIVCPFSALTRYQAVLPGVEEAMALIAGQIGRASCRERV